VLLFISTAVRRNCWSMAE